MTPETGAGKNLMPDACQTVWHTLQKPAPISGAGFWSMCHWLKSEVIGWWWWWWCGGGDDGGGDDDGGVWYRRMQQALKHLCDDNSLSCCIALGRDLPTLGTTSSLLVSVRQLHWVKPMFIVCLCVYVCMIRNWRNLVWISVMMNPRTDIDFSDIWLRLLTSEDIWPPA